MHQYYSDKFRNTNSKIKDMEEIEQLLAKLKRDQNALHTEFKHKITLIYTGNQKKFKYDTFRELEDIISSVFSLTYMFKKSREQHYVRDRKSVV